MPGRSRIDAAGALHHTMVRGIERIELFRGDTDSNHFAERPVDSGDGLWPWALARDRVPSEGKSSRGRPERSAAKSKGDEVGAPGSTRGDPLAEVPEDTKAKGCPLPSS